MTVPSEKKLLIYIIGAGRSGTTLLDILIGNGENIFSIGELNRFPNHDGIPPEFEPETKNYRFWQQIRSRVVRDFDLMSQKKHHSQFEYHVGLLLQLAGLYSRKSLNVYHSFLCKMYKIIFAETDVDTLIESSKYPGRALNLSKVLPYRLAFIYLKRDPVRVVQSFQKKNIEQPPKHWIIANLYYFLVNLLCHIVLSGIKNKHMVITIKYEDLLREPIATLEAIQQHLDVNLLAAIEKIRANRGLEVGCLFDGNRIRTQEEIYIQGEESAKTFDTIDRLTRTVNYLFYH